jgi:hypothetical protein
MKMAHFIIMNSLFIFHMPPVYTAITLAADTTDIDTPEAC